MEYYRKWKCEKWKLTENEISQFDRSPLFWRSPNRQSIPMPRHDGYLTTSLFFFEPIGPQSQVNNNVFNIDYDMLIDIPKPLTLVTAKILWRELTWQLLSELRSQAKLRSACTPFPLIHAQTAMHKSQLQPVIFILFWLDIGLISQSLLTVRAHM